MGENKEQNPAKLTKSEKSNIYNSFNKNPEEFFEYIDGIENESKIFLTAQSQSFSGPLPHPDILKGYKDIDEEIPKKIIKMVEDDHEHNINLEKNIVNENIKIEKTGMYLGLIMGLASLGLGGFLIYSDKDIYGLVALLPSLIGMASSFLKSNKKEENKEKNNQ